jgi:hypothetical protein
MCVHQACYGIEEIPQGSWLCAPCDFGGPQFRPECVLCPNSAGAMKPTKNFRYWAHVACALWIPEVGFGDPIKMEPIVNLNKIPPAKWQLTCSLCKEKRGCCFQCCEKKCHLAFHITCAFKFNLVMKHHDRMFNGNDSDSQDQLPAQLEAYCFKHSKKRRLEEENNNEEDESNEKENNNLGLNAQDEIGDAVDIKIHYDASKLDDLLLDDENDEHLLNLLSRMNENERKIEIIKRIQLLNKHFYKNVNLNLAQSLVGIRNQLHVQLVFNYWKLKRRFNVMTISSMDNTVLPVENKPLMMHRNEQDVMNRNEQMLLNSVKSFVQLRQDLERVRTLTYMTAKREKLKKQIFALNHDIFLKQVDYMNKYASATLPTETNVLRQKSINTNNQCTSSSSSSKSTTMNSRLREILQTKNKECIYDYPELWSLSRVSASKRKKPTVSDESSKKFKPKINTKIFSNGDIKKKTASKTEFVNKIKNKYKTIKLNSNTKKK